MVKNSKYAKNKGHMITPCPFFKKGQGQACDHLTKLIEKSDRGDPKSLLKSQQIISRYVRRYLDDSDLVPKETKEYCLVIFDIDIDVIIKESVSQTVPCIKFEEILGDLKEQFNDEKKKSVLWAGLKILVSLLSFWHTWKIPILNLVDKIRNIFSYLISHLIG